MRKSVQALLKLHLHVRCHEHLSSDNCQTHCSCIYLDARIECTILIMIGQFYHASRILAALKLAGSAAATVQSCAYRILNNHACMAAIISTNRTWYMQPFKLNVAQ